MSLAACGSGANPDPGSPTEDAQIVDLDNLLITVHGQVALLPEAARMMSAQGQPPPALRGLPILIEEPLRVGVSDPSASFGSGTLDDDGKFSISEVPVKDIHQSLAVRVTQEGFAPVSTVVFDTAFTGARPRTDLINTHVWAVPMAFQDTLTQALSPETLRVLTEGRAETVLQAGFVLGRVVDAAGQPVAGARVWIEQGELQGRLYYPSEDLSRVGQEGTSANGLFLYVHSGAAAETFRVSLHDAETYVWRNAGAMPGHGFVLTLFPGAHAP